LTTTTLSSQAATLGLAIGLAFSLVCYLATNLSPGGMITPAWLALILVQDLRHAILVAATTVATYLGTRVLQRFVILYGKRLFAAIVLLGVLLSAASYLLIETDYPYLFTAQTLGFVVPGLITYQLVRQPMRPTLIAIAAVTGASYVVLASGILLGALPSVG
jgi:poly-gamma-glutamate biosynthesis protein PgsC/CapC